MIELFTIFGKGGLVLWYFSEGSELFKSAVNDLISNVLLQVSIFLNPLIYPSMLSNFFNTYEYVFYFFSLLFQERNVASFNHEGMTVKYKLDNELDIVILVVYQSIIQLSYADKLLTEVQLRFRDLYKNVLEEGRYYSAGPKVFNGFNNEFNRFAFIHIVISLILLLQNFKFYEVFGEYSWRGKETQIISRKRKI